MYEAQERAPAAGNPPVYPPPSFPGGDKDGIVLAIHASLYDALSGRALRASSNLDPATANMGALASAKGEPRSPAFGCARHARRCCLPRPSTPTARIL